MASFRQYLEYAHQCARRALETDNGEEKQTFIDMAEAWDHIALIEHDVSKEAQKAFSSEHRRQFHS